MSNSKQRTKRKDGKQGAMVGSCLTLGVGQGKEKVDLIVIAG